MKKFVAPILIVTIAASAAGAMVWLKKPAAEEPVPDATLTVEISTLTRGEVQFSVVSQGTVGARTETTLVAEVSGAVLEVSPDFVAGGFFAKGDVLLRIDPADHQVALEQARANLAGMRAKLTLEIARAEQAEKEWALSGRTREQAPLLALRTPYLEEAKANVLHAEAELKKAERKLDRTIIRAPYPGMVRSKAVDVGQYVGVGTQLGATIAVDFAEVRLPLSERDLARLDLPRPGAFSDDAGPVIELRAALGGREQTWEARIVRTEGVVDERSRVHYAVARIQDPYQLNSAGTRSPLAIGTFVRARIPGLRRADLYTVPRQAIRNGNSVYLMDAEDRLRIRELTIESEDDAFAYVSAGLSDTDRVITSAVDVPVAGRALKAAGS